MKHHSIFLSAAALLTASMTSFAADRETILTHVQAPVMVNQGENYVEATQSMLLYPGDRLMVMQGGSAQVQFANGCVQSIRSNEITTVGDAQACVTHQAAGTYNQVGSTGTAGGGSGSSDLDPAGIIFSVAVGGGFMYAITDDGNDREPPPASP
ncbi:hypothetical protein E2F43_15025 [Seongchinamella unica]|uniref:Uncharacterized protein n=1 Tax=Seongchinamella unica TaxID=2547392 RepID=A0A4R5LQR3_9GAMM|nr:hypothetical protein [Seongchinamella unica]TDG12869.1 hypothetical protein E2F43_15025 [Seongchinamella unica]